MRTISVSGADIGLDSRRSLAVATDLEAMRQRIEAHLRWLFGEWFLDTAGGLPYFDSRDAGIVTAGILEVPGVLDVVDIRSERDTATRRLTYTATVETSLGSIQVSG